MIQELIKNRDELFTEIKSSKKLLDRLYYAKARWREERYYEDFKEYIEFAKKQFADTNFELMRMTKGFKITLKHKSGTQCELHLLATKFTFRII
jgi:hypothetical protein